MIASEEKDAAHVKELAQLRESVEQRARTLAVRNPILNRQICCGSNCTAASTGIIESANVAHLVIPATDIVHSLPALRSACLACISTSMYPQPAAFVALRRRNE